MQKRMMMFRQVNSPEEEAAAYKESGLTKEIAYQRCMRIAENCLKDKKYEEVFVLAENAKRIQPENESAYRLLGSLYRQRADAISPRSKNDRLARTILLNYSFKYYKTTLEKCNAAKKTGARNEIEKELENLRENIEGEFKKIEAEFASEPRVEPVSRFRLRFSFLTPRNISERVAYLNEKTQWEMELGHYTEAEALSLEALTLHPFNLWTYFLLSEIYRDVAESLDSTFLPHRIKKLYLTLKSIRTLEDLRRIGYWFIGPELRESAKQKTISLGKNFSKELAGISQEILSELNRTIEDGPLPGDVVMGLLASKYKNDLQQKDKGQKTEKNIVVNHELLQAVMPEFRPYIHVAEDNIEDEQPRYPAWQNPMVLRGEERDQLQRATFAKKNQEKDNLDKKHDAENDDHFSESTQARKKKIKRRPHLPAEVLSSEKKQDSVAESTTTTTDVNHSSDMHKEKEMRPRTPIELDANRPVSVAFCNTASIAKSLSSQVDSVPAIKHNVNREILEKYFPHLMKIADELIKRKFSVYATGGSVRDLLLNKRPKDLDLAIKMQGDGTLNETREQLKKTLQELKIEYTEINGRFPILQLHCKDEHADAAIFRKYQQDNPYADEKAGHAFSFDSFGRNFTFNAIYLDLSNSTLFDAVNGLKDILQERKIRFIGDPSKRIPTDPMMMLQAIRFKHVLSFQLEEKLEETIRGGSDYLNAVNHERLIGEIEKLLKLDHEILGLIAKDLQHYGLLQPIFRNLEKNYTGAALPSVMSIKYFFESLIRLNHFYLEDELHKAALTTIELLRSYDNYHRRLRNEDARPVMTSRPSRAR